MKTLSYIFGRVVSSEINRSIARSEAQNRKTNEINREIASGKDANAAFAKWIELNPNHPLLEQYTLEVNKVNNDLRLTDVTRGIKMARIAQNAWRLAQQESQAGRAQALPASANPIVKKALFKGAVFLTIFGFIMVTCSKHETQQPEQAAAAPAAEVSTPAPTPVATPAAIFTPTESDLKRLLPQQTSAKSDLIDYPLRDSTPTPAKRRSYKHHN
jgi:hypothetical protein